MCNNPMSDHTVYDFDESLPRYEYNEVDFELDDDFLSYKGKPFTGLVYEKDENTGSLTGQETYLDGLPNGLCRFWYPNGKLRSQSLMRRGNGCHENWAWHADGSKKEYGKTIKIDGVDLSEDWVWHENGVQKIYLKRIGYETEIYKEWDEDGNPVQRYFE